MNFAALPEFHVRSDPDAPALVFDGEVTTYGDLDRRANAFANLLETTDVTEEDLVVLFAPNIPETVVVHLGCLKHGSVVIPVNQRYTEHEVQHILKDLKPSVLVTVPELVDEVPSPEGTSLNAVYVAGTGDDGAHQVDGVFGNLDAKLASRATEYQSVPRRNDAVANLMYTSGSTGDPKPVVHQHGFHHAVGGGRVSFFDLDRSDVAVIASPLFHISGLGVLDMALYSGSPAILLSEWSADRYLEAIERHGGTYTHLITTVLLELANSNEDYLESFDTDSLDVVLSGGGSIDTDQIRRFEHLVGGIVCEGYGRTEGGFAYNRPGERILGTNGVPMYDVNDLRIVDPDTGSECVSGEMGEIQVRGEAVTLGYYERPTLTETAFLDEDWMHTGDLGWLDSDGFLHFDGRQGEMIKSGGENVSPSEVETVLQEIDTVMEAAVVGLSDETWGERVAAAVVRSDEAVTAEDIEAYCRGRLAGFKLPRTIVFVESLPKQGSRKVDRTAVVDIIERRTGEE